MAQNKKLFAAIALILISSILSLLAYSEAEIKSFVNDYANVISPEYKIQIENTLKKVYDSKIAEFSIVTIESLNGQDIESYSLSLAQGKLGDKEKNNGLLLLVAVNDRKYRFEVGRGIEPMLNDAKTGRIARDYLVENFRRGDYGKGIYESALAASSVLLGETNSEYYIDETAPKKNPPSYNLLAILVFFMIFSSIIGYFGKNAHTYRKRDRFFDAAMMAGLMFGGRGKGCMGGFGGGGFGGFGGGGFGGGGASGGW